MLQCLLLEDSSIALIHGNARPVPLFQVLWIVGSLVSSVSCCLAVGQLLVACWILVGSSFDTIKFHLCFINERPGQALSALST